MPVTLALLLLIAVVALTAREFIASVNKGWQA